MGKEIKNIGKPIGFLFLYLLLSTFFVKAFFSERPFLGQSFLNIFFSIYLIYDRRKNHKKQKLKIKNEKKLDKFDYFVLIFFSLIGLRMLTQTIGLFVKVNYGSKQFNDYVRYTEDMSAFVFASLITSPFFEELFFRSYLYDRFKDQWGVFIAIIVQAVLFGLIHGNIVQIIGTIPLGIYWGILIFKFDNIILNIVTHFLYNGFNFIMTMGFLPFERFNPFVMFLLYTLIIFLELSFLKYLEKKSVLES